jgi:hypothetical protein
MDMLSFPKFCIGILNDGQSSRTKVALHFGLTFHVSQSWEVERFPVLFTRTYSHTLYKSAACLMACVGGGGGVWTCLTFPQQRFIEKSFLTSCIKL